MGGDCSEAQGNALGRSGEGSSDRGALLHPRHAFFIPIFFDAGVRPLLVLVCALARPVSMDSLVCCAYLVMEVFSGAVEVQTADEQNFCFNKSWLLIKAKTQSKGLDGRVSWQLWLQRVEILYN